MTSLAVSFDPHPAVVHEPAGSHVDIMGQAGRQAAMAELGVDVHLLLHYDLDFAAQTPEEFVTRVLVDTLGARCVVIGDDVRFGANNSGDLVTMQELGKRHGFDVVVVEDLLASDERRCSSTTIRQLLVQGKVEEAGSLLGRPHYMRGEVIHGAARGRELGFPTANLSLASEGLVPADGVYAGWLSDEQGMRYPVAISVGTNPTFEGVTRRQVEAHVMDRTDKCVEDFDLYGQQVTLEFVAFLRGMVAYTGVEALVAQMHQDVAQAREILVRASSSL